jgi:hypothetical protein
MSRWPRYFILDAQGVPQPSDLMAWAQWDAADRTRRIVAHTDVDHEGNVLDEEHARHAVAEVSTVFLGFDHNHWDVGPPILYETLVFANEPTISKIEGRPPLIFERTSIDESMRRYHTREEALQGHAETLAILQHALIKHVPLITAKGTHWPYPDEA